MEQPTRSKLLRSTQLVYKDEKSQYFHKLDEDIVTQSPLLSKKKKRESRMGLPKKTKVLFGEENANQDNQVSPIINKKVTLKHKKEKKSKGKEAPKKKQEDEVKKEEKKEEEKEGVEGFEGVEEEEVDDKKLGRGRSMNWADMDDDPVLKQYPTFPEPRRRHARMRSLQPSHPDISSKFKFYYTSPDCKACEKMSEFCGHQVPPPLESRSADTNPLKLNEALTFARKHKEVLILEKGGCERIPLNTQFDPPTSFLEKKILQKDGRMRTPMSVIGYTLVVGFNEEIMRESLFFGNKSPTSFKRKRRGSLSRPLSSMKRTKN